MVETRPDPVRVPTITLSQAELDEIEALMERGELPADYLDRYFDAVEANVFGHDHKKHKDGTPIEQGRGSPGNQTRQSIDAFKKYGRPEKGASEAEFKEFADQVRRMEGELKACDEARAAATPPRRRRGARR